MSRVKSIHELYLVNSEGDHTFYHAKPLKSPSLGQLQNELTRLEAHKFETKEHQLLSRLHGRTAIILNFNIQSLSAHMEDLMTDTVCMKANVLCLTETWNSNESTIMINGYRLVAQNKRPGRTGGVALYVKQSVSCESGNHHQPVLTNDDCGDLCVGEVVLGGKRHKIITVYFNPGTTFTQLKEFLQRNRNILDPVALEENSTPFMICGDFNYNMRLEDSRLELLSFMEEQFNFILVNDPSQPTTHNQSCIDLVFSRNIDNVECALSESYSSFHKPMLILLK